MAKPLENIVPCHDLILVVPATGSQAAGTNLLLAGKAKVLPTGRGRVVLTGPGVYDKDSQLVPLPCKAGDYILYADPGAIEVDRAKRVLIAANAVLAVLPDGLGEPATPADDQAPTSSLILD